MVFSLYKPFHFTPHPSATPPPSPDFKRITLYRTASMWEGFLFECLKIQIKICNVTYAGNFFLRVISLDLFLGFY